MTDPEQTGEVVYVLCMAWLHHKELKNVFQPAVNVTR